ncbi:SpaH/EbpB family LPXTG-anchored major pilin [Corynebacterium timonense]|uniref:LPXTG-motif cell wall anchor domain-containing protein/fimbrial isopeptide formation D2 domain-containing protein n=1 Tax=Corynebacterium timonense TaxID=441500 RepID=A0A1H1U0K0_9CORY|nr:SpaH/EbpB family LPXTG-anchored major pilin [Corynebacterium timonense]SDS65851.1 LPXTG-motif cell wall anchor domain-containing protein/fimbrial isopeptide formation D2 domain-containing protein [Corynebacterium timonense]
MRFIATSRTVAACAAAGIALSTAAATAPVVFAQDTNPAPTVSAANIDPARLGSITINKRLNPEQILPGLGVEQPNASGSPAAGVTFTATKINRNITTPEGFAQLAAMTPAEAAQNLDVTVTRTGDTGADGQVRFDDLPVGAYLVQESINGPVTAGGQTLQPGQIVSGPAFIVFVPFTQRGEAGGTSWNYDPVVYPKNSSLTTEKSVVDAADGKGDNVGDEVNYQIRSTVPAVPAGQTLGEYHIHDRYDTTELGNVTVGSVTIQGRDDALVEGIHYTVEDTVLPDGRAQKTVAFTEAGRALLAANSGATVVVNLTAALLALGDNGDGEIVNETQTTGFTREGDATHEFETPKDEVVTYLARVQVIKHAEGDKSRRLQGAEFQLYQADACTTEGLATETPLTVGGNNTWVTNAEGEFIIDGLHVTDFANNADAKLPNFCLVETKAPAGFQLLTQPIAVELLHTETHAAGQTVPLKTIEVANVQTGTPTLPATGGAGVALLLLLGAGIVGGGVYAARRNSAEA